MKEPKGAGGPVLPALSLDLRAFATFVEAISEEKAKAKALELDIAGMMKEGAKPEDLD